jgi:hypothetical protein
MLISVLYIIHHTSKNRIEYFSLFAGKAFGQAAGGAGYGIHQGAGLAINAYI